MNNDSESNYASNIPDISEVSETNTNSDFFVNKLPKKVYTYNDKKQLVKRISDIKYKKCYIKLFKVIYGDNLKYTKNDNGIFFNINNLSDDILLKIEAVIMFYENKKVASESILRA
jgi:hypothetical protein